ncbi:hypothetical protein EUTSA_v10007184mg [Eutrema salsugineum]|uniref:SET domain-containing protein n=1 Tax=Eutrema salsugineum TaxID=72664 RepID=V4KFK7_EUTSA|nr:hypothetical protein EUTSA_v10007184mg [Eutrema salsugineum]
MAPDPRIKKACIAMKAFDIPESKVRPIIRQLRKSYDNKWNFIEQDNYRVLIDAIFDEEDVQATEKKKEEEKESNVCSLAMTRGKKRALEQTQLVVKDEEDDIEEEEFPLKRRLRRKRDGVCDNNTSIGIGKPTSKKPNEEDRNLEEEEEEEDEDDEKTEPPPLKRYSRRAGESGSARTVYNNTSPSFSTPMSVEPEELPPITLLPADPVVAEKASDSETVSDMIKVGDESGAADISMGLVIVPECEISADGWRAFSNTKDITGGEENIQIPWVNEINDEVPSRFRYIPHSFVFQDAAVKLFSVSSFSDDQSCFFCIGDCLDTSSTPCSCTTAYTVEGVLKEDVLEARISEARDQRKQVLQFCQECPLEKAKKEEILEPCKGHIKRKAIKECWIKCGCAKRCGNRLVQRGIHNKLEVFFTPNGKGWGVRTLERLAQGSFVCEYAGEILTITELYQRRSENELTSPVILDAHWGSEECLEDDKSLCLDGTGYGNISRFLNHRCLDANLIEIPVQVETPYQHYYRLAFFTTRDIEAMEELTWDYGIDFNDEDCLMKHFDCVCGSRFCRNIKQAKKAKKIMIRA